MIRIDLAGRLHAAIIHIITCREGLETIGRTSRHQSLRAATHIRLNIGRGRGAGGGGMMFQSPLLFCSVYDAEIINTDFGLGCGPGSEQVRNRQRGQQSDDAHDYHNFDKRKRPPSIIHGLHVIFFTFQCGCERCKRRIYLIGQ